MFIRCNILYYALLAVSGVLNQSIKGERQLRRRRLAGGQEEGNGGRPYAAFLHFTPATHCSGVIVSPTAELTAAHCCIDSRNVTNAFVFAGNVWFRNKEDFAPPTQTRRLSLCRSYNALAVYEYDIMICRHELPWKFDKYFVSPVQIFTITERLRPAFKLRCQVAGFGRKDTGLAVGYLHAYQQVMETWRACRNVPSDQFMCTTDTANKTMCHGDAGGPVVCLVNQRIQLFGVLSTSSAPEPECCETPVAWNLVSFIGYYRDWLKWNIPDLPSEGYFTDPPETTTAPSYTEAVSHTAAHYVAEGAAVLGQHVVPQTCPCFTKTTIIGPVLSACPICPMLPITTERRREISGAFAASPSTAIVAGALLTSCIQLLL